MGPGEFQGHRAWKEKRPAEDTNLGKKNRKAPGPRSQVKEVRGGRSNPCGRGSRCGRKDEG